MMFILPTLSVALVLSQMTPLTEAGRAVAAQEAERLSACLDLVETDPEAAYEEGLDWLADGGRPGARHCAAVALIGLGQEAEGAARLESLANAPDAGSLEARTLYLAKAGNAWLLAGFPDAALVTLDNALKLSPGTPDLLKDRATARLALSQWHEAIGDLDSVIDERPSDVEALTLRARANLQLAQYDKALADVTAARAVEPENIDLLVLRGDIRNAQR